MYPLLYRTDSIRRLEALAISKGIPESVLMQRAGTFAWQSLRQRWPHCKSITVFCGSGNNAGDGLVLACLAEKANIKVNVILVEDPEKLTGNTKEVWHTVCQLQIPWQRWEGKLPETEVWVDALLGIGIKGEVKEIYRSVINTINAKTHHVLSIDIPSGLDPDTGWPLGSAVYATVTATMIGIKPGLVTGQGKEYTGELVYSDLDIPSHVYQEVTPAAQCLHLPTLQMHLKKRPRHAHKHQFGHVLVIGGDYGMGGAVHLCAKAALVCGAGVASVATRPEHAFALVGSCPELLSYGIEDTKTIEKLIERATVIVIGPGLGQEAWGVSLLEKVFSSALPLIIDADALNILARKSSAREGWILTPHSGEAARLLHTSTSAVEQDRLKAVSELQKQYQGVIVLKGAGSLIQNSDNIPWMCMEGNPGMATAGMGDVLSGVIAALVAQGLSLEEAALLGVAMHAAAGDQLAKQYGERGLKAGDMYRPLQQLANPFHHETE